MIHLQSLTINTFKNNMLVLYENDVNILQYIPVYFAHNGHLH